MFIFGSSVLHDGGGLVIKSCLNFATHPMDYSSSVHGISQARILEWFAISSSSGSCCPRDQIQASCIGIWIFYCLSHQGSPFAIYFPLLLP